MGHLLHLTPKKRCKTVRGLSARHYQLGKTWREQITRTLKQWILFPETCESFVQHLNSKMAREQFVHHALLTFLDLHGMSFWNTSTQLVDLLLELLCIHIQVMSDEDGMYGLLRSPHLQQTPSQSMNIHMPVSFSGQDLK